MKKKALDNPTTPNEIADALEARFGRNVPEGDGWSWEWQVDPLARKAASEIRSMQSRLQAQEEVLNQINKNALANL